MESSKVHDDMNKLASITVVVGSPVLDYCTYCSCAVCTTAVTGRTGLMMVTMMVISDPNLILNLQGGK